ncbi:methylmalonyl-CoA mutase family protein [Fredinandcohnia sp. 179-A 10B2 NHS]|uniref:methylmalonyl-CoA mutase family protein n=1 Tax=Fredinandcohnia sp. 179-A 10B2 NHS TaxID=3235176 RepID=UPI0039A0A8AF
MAEQSSNFQDITFSPVDYEAWKKEAEKSLKGKTIEKLHTKTYENIILKPIYTKKDIEHLPHVKELPGFDSMMRGTTTSGYLNNSWFVSQELNVENPDEFNTAAKEALANGQTMIHINLHGENSNDGLQLHQLENMRKAFTGITLATTPVLIDTNSELVSFLNTLAVYLNEQNETPRTLAGTIGMDPLGLLVETGELQVPLSNIWAQLADAVNWAITNETSIRTILVKGQPYHNGGANAVQELAYTLATATEYISVLEEKGLDFNEIAKRMTFSFSIGSNVFMEIAKLRAARVVWSAICKAYGGSAEEAKMHIHARTSAFTKTVFDPYVNMLRSTTEAFSAIIGGVDSLHVSAFDEAIRKTNSFSRRIARNTQSILKEESHLHRVLDPAGGSWYIEALTNELADAAWTLFKEVEAEGGLLKALKSGSIQSKVKDVYKARQHNVNHRKDKIVGTNMYANLAEKTLVTEKLTPARSKQNNSQPAVVINHIPTVRIAENFESLRHAANEYARKTGEFPKIGLINIGPIPEHKPRADFISGFFEAGGFQIVKNDGYLTVNAAISGAKAMNLDTFVFCGKDEAYKEMIVEISKELKAINPGIRLYIAGKQEGQIAQEYKNAGINDFIHIKTDCYSFLYQLQQEMGVHSK